MPQLAEVIALARQIKAAGDIAHVKHLAGRIARGDCSSVTRADAEFNEADHPRAEDGKFGSGGGSSHSGSSFGYEKKEILAGSKNEYKNGDTVILEDILPSGRKLYLTNKATGGFATLEEAHKAGEKETKRNKSFDDIPKTWSGDSKNAAKELIKSGYTDLTYNQSTQSKSKYITITGENTQVKLRISDHPMSSNYDDPDVNYIIGSGSIKDAVSKAISLLKERDSMARNDSQSRADSDSESVTELSIAKIIPTSPKDQIIQALRKIVGEEVRNDAEFKESDHPRAEDGKFGGGAGNSKHISSVEKRATYIMPGKHDGIVKGEKVWRLPDAPDYFLSKDGNYFKDEGNGITKKLKSTSKESVIQHIENRDIERQKEKEKASEPNNKFIDSAAKFAKERGMEYRIERPNDASSRYMYLETKFGTKKIRIADHPQPTFFNSDTQKYETRGGYDKKGAPHDPADYSFTTGDNPADVHKIISALAKGEEPISYGKGWNKGESEWDVRKRVIQGLSEETSSDSANPSSPKDQIIQALKKIVA